VWCFSQHRFYKELRVLQKISYDAQRLASQKDTTTKHEVRASYNPDAQQVVAQSQNYATRVTRGTSATVRIYSSPLFIEQIVNSFDSESNG
jgi:hypothetical protein